MRRFAALIAPLLLAGAAKADLDAETKAKLDAAFAPWNKPDQPGGVAGVMKDGKLVYAKGFGLASLEFRAPLTADSVIDIGSVSKHFTSTALLLLEDQGKLKLSDDIRVHIPELPEMPQVVTLRHMLTHTSGLRDYFTLFALAGWEAQSPLKESEVLEMAKRQRGLNFPPGTGWSYSNTNYVLAAIVVERTAKQPFAEFVKENIFSRLGMTSTRFDSDVSAVVPGRVPSYRQTGTVWTRLNPLDVPIGDGALLTTINDFAKWDEALRTNKLGLKAPGHLARLSAPAVVPNVPVQYGLGLMSDKFEGLSRIQHGGDWLGFNAQYSILPDKRLSVFTFGNDGTQLGKSLNTEALKVLAGSQQPAAPAGETAERPWTSELFAKVSGNWSLKLPNGVLTAKVFVQNGARVMQADGQPAVPIFSASDEMFFVKAAPIKIVKVKADEKGVWTEARLEQEVGGSTVKVEMTRAEPLKATKEQAEAIAGKYFSPELKVVYVVRASGTGVLVTLGSQNPAPVMMDSPTSGSIGMLKMSFKLGANGRAESMTVDAGRASGLVFERLRD